MSEVRNLVLAVILSVLVMLGWRIIYEKFFIDDRVVVEESIDPMMLKPEEHVVYRPRTEVITHESKNRVKISNKKIHGSILLKGARFDDITLAGYHVTSDPSSPETVLLSPAETEEIYFIEFGWMDPKNKITLPNQSTMWSADRDSVSNNQKVTLSWDNKEGVIFKLIITPDNNYMFQVEQVIENNTDEPIYLVPYGRINRSRSVGGNRSYWISHEGAVGAFEGKLKEWTYKNLISEKNVKVSHSIKQDATVKDWIGIADKYWITTIIPGVEPSDKLSFHAKHAFHNNEDRFQVDFSKSYQKVSPQSSQSNINYLFTGAKELKLLDKYRNDLHISLFDKAVDLGVMYFITKPVFTMLEYFNGLMGNFGLAIILLTILMKIIMLPLSNKSYVSMFKLKKLQPNIMRLKELHKNDNMKLNKEIALLFKKNNVSPMSGFLPILIQVPVFFALYKVLFVTIEMRHAPFYLWITDLSNPDPANLLTLFGFLKYNAPICIGVLPVILGITMVIQQKISNIGSTQDQIQMNVMKFLPYIFIFIFASFPAGLIIYWICSNTITIIQQLTVKYLSSQKSKLMSKNLTNEGI